MILAAGASRRMGQSKLLLRWGGETIVARVAEGLRTAGARQVAAVHAPGDEALLAELRRIGVEAIPNPAAPAADMFSSICCGLAWPGWAGGVSHLAIAPGDMPAVAPATLRGLFALAAAHPDRVCQPSCGGRRGHPVLVPRAQAARIAGGGHADLRAALDGLPVLTLATDDAGVHTDIDTPDDFQALHGLSRP